MKVEVWSDVYCPFCYIAESRLEKALAKYQKGDQVGLVFRSFELDPSLEEGKAYPAPDYLAQKYQISLEQAKERQDAIAEIAKEEGLDFRFDRALITNTKKGHRLLHFAQEQGLGQKMAHLLFEAHFYEGLDLSQDTVLVDLARQAGLDPERAQEVVSSQEFMDALEADQLAGHELGITAVPFFLFDGRFSISGAQPQEVFEEALEKAFALESKPVNLGAESSDMTCGPNGCFV